MGWWEDFTTGAKNTVTGDSSNSGGTIGEALGGIAASKGISTILDKTGITDSFAPNIPVTGYQGGIPSYEAIRERVPTDPNRRAGGQNQRYFTDMQYAKGREGFLEAEPVSIEDAKAKATAQRAMLAQRNQSPPQGMAMGGIASVNNGYYLGGKTDGMADEVPATIGGTQEARLSDGEFVIPADVVSHLGNGNSDAGADQLHGMMDNVRKERTGNSEQGKQIDPNKFMPTMAQGGIANAYNNGGSVFRNQTPKTNFVTGDPVVDTNIADTSKIAVDPDVGVKTGVESSLSSWAGPYVTDMLGKGSALANQGYQQFDGPLTAGTSNLQDKSFTGIGALEAPQNMGAFTPKEFTAEDAKKGMNPYLMASLNPQLDEARRQSEISRVGNAGRMTQAGAFGGSRQALMDMENQRNLETNLGNITGQGYASAYDRAQQQFNTQQDRGMQAQNQANKYGFDVLGGQATAGATQRGIEQQGLSSDISQFEEERDFPYKQVQYLQSLLQGLPLESQSINYSQPSDFQTNMQAAGGVSTLLEKLYGGTSGPPTTAQTGAAMGLTPAEILAGTVGYGDAVDELASIPDDY